MNNFNISSGDSVKSNAVEVTSISNIFEQIRTDKTLKENVERIRQLETDNERRDAKVILLPYFVGATFTNGIRTAENLITAEMMILDFDHVGEQYAVLWEKIIQDSEAYFAFRSPSGDGIKVGYVFEKPVTSAEHYTAVYLKYKERKEIEYGVNADEVTKNVSRTCFLSYDLDLYVNDNAVPIVVSDIQVTQKPQSTTKTTPINFHQVDKSKTKYVYNAVNFLREKLNGYAEWMKCGFALASLGDEGRSYFHILSSNPSYNDSFEYVDEKFENFVQTATGEIDLATLFAIAKSYGFEYSNQSESPTIISQPAVPKSFGDELREKFAFYDTRDPNELIGYKLDKFKALAKNLDGVQPGFYLIAAESNVGKTALLTNLELDLLLTNPQLKIVHFSMDDNKFYTVNRLISILTKFNINNVIKACPDPNDQNTLNAKRELILDLVDTGRLIMKDLGDLNHIDQVLDTLTSIGSFENLVVFIDGMYNLNVEAGEGIRIENIKRAQTIKELVDKCKIPVIATGELRKRSNTDSKNKKPTLSDINETGKYAYNASVVLLLYPLNVDQLKEDQCAIKMEFVKNKLSDYKGIQDLIFIRATGTMEENNLQIGVSNTSTTQSDEVESGGELD
ncbi:MAG: PriCT-2 domain-containing protein [Ignavibacteriales bacterium]|nr:PriCT-2 domain-containing protein [Ignavibacteriales bacterium]